MLTFIFDGFIWLLRYIIAYKLTLPRIGVDVRPATDRIF